MHLHTLSFPPDRLRSRALPGEPSGWRAPPLIAAAALDPWPSPAACSFEAPGLLSGVLGVVLTGAMAHKGVGLSANVPCVAARKLRQLEAGAAAALGGAGEPGEQQQQQAAASGGGSLEPLASKCGGGGGGSDDDSKQASRGRPVIELTAVATTPRGLAGLQEAPLRGRSAATEVCTDAAQGLLAALVSQTRRGGVPAAVGLAEEAEDGEGALLPSGAARSHHDTTACALERSALAASSRSGGGGGQLLGDARLGDAGSHAVDADTAAYLRDRRELARRLAPWAAMLCVVAGTRVPYLQRSNGQELRLSLRSLGDFTISSNLVLQFRDLCRWAAGCGVCVCVCVVVGWGGGGTLAGACAGAGGGLSKWRVGGSGSGWAVRAQAVLLRHIRSAALPAHLLHPRSAAALPRLHPPVVPNQDRSELVVPAALHARAAPLHRHRLRHAGCLPWQHPSGQVVGGPLCCRHRQVQG